MSKKRATRTVIKAVAGGKTPANKKGSPRSKRRVTGKSSRRDSAAFSSGGTVSRKKYSKGGSIMPKAKPC